MQTAGFHPGLADGDLFVGRKTDLRALRRWWMNDAWPPLFISGPRRIGKTTLVKRFARELEVPTRFISWLDSAVPRGGGWRALNQPTLEDIRGGSRETTLVVVDNIEGGAARDLADLHYAIRECPNRRWLLVGSEPVPGPWTHRGLNELSLGESTDLLRRGLPNLSSAQLQSLAATTEGVPFVVHLVGSLLERGEPADNVLARLKDMRWDAGAWVARAASAPGGVTELDMRLQTVGHALLQRLARDPELMYRLPPRRFEELVAELYARQGFNVELTPETHDAGVDLYVIEHTAYGRLLTVIDCKRNGASRPVGVRLVRELLGTVHATDASAGVLVTTSRFTRPASQLAGRYPFRLGLQDYFDLQTMLREVAM